MKIFLDTNAYFSCFDTDPLSQLKELARVVEDKKLKLEIILTEQVAEEFLRGIGERIEQSRKSLKITNIVLPQNKEISKEDLKTLREAIEKIHKDKEKECIKKIEKFEKETLEAEKITHEIFKNAKRISTSKEIIEKAQLRWIKGNPPKKKNDSSYGDAISWESLLQEKIEDELVVISNDGDYSETYKEEKIINRFLKKEWEEKTGKKVQLYTTIARFLNDIGNKEVINKKDAEKELKNSEILSTGEIFWSPATTATGWSNSISTTSSILAGNTILSATTLNPNTVMWGNDSITFSNLGGVTTAYARTCLGCGKFYTPQFTEALITDNGFCENCNRLGRDGTTGIFIPR